jgi:hypothetical protein
VPARQRLLNGPLALALSLTLHGAVVGLLSLPLRPAAEKGPSMVASPVQISLLYNGPTLLDRDPQILPAAFSGQDSSEISEATILPAVGQPEPAVPSVTGPTRAVGTSGQGAAKGTATETGPAPSFFPAAGQARSVVYVIDRSMSMGLRGALGAARRELLASLDRLPEHVRFQVVVYDRTAELLAPGADLVAATAENKRHTAARIESLCAEGGTSHLPALRKALSLAPEVIYFLTDADDLNPQEQQAVTQLNRGRCSLHVIELNTSHRDRPWMPLQELARRNRGTYQAIDLSAYRD